MSEPKWTPGPWESERAIEAKHWYVATSTSKPPSDIVLYGEDAEANARLIAAAPELYEALERILRTPINGVQLQDWEDYNVKEAMGILAKARGEKS